LHDTLSSWHGESTDQSGQHAQSLGLTGQHPVIHALYQTLDGVLYADCRLAHQQQCGPCPGSNPFWTSFQLLCIYVQAGGAGIALAAFDGPQDMSVHLDMAICCTLLQPLLRHHT